MPVKANAGRAWANIVESDEERDETESEEIQNIPRTEVEFVQNTLVEGSMENAREREVFTPVSRHRNKSNHIATSGNSSAGIRILHGLFFTPERGSEASMPSSDVFRPHLTKSQKRL